MKNSFGVFAAGLLLAMSVGCGREAADPEAPELPPVAETPAAPTTSDGYQVVTVADGGAISGTITLSGSLPTLPARPTGRDPEVCGTEERPSDRLIVGGNGGLSNAVVIVEGVASGKPMPAEALSAQLDQSGCDYLPHVSVAAANTEIEILNSDPILHNVQFFQGNDTLFNIAQPVQGQVNTTTVENVGIIDVECAVHAWMRASVVVVDNPYYAVTDANGDFSIADLPAGTYQVKIWHEYLGEETREITVAAGADTALDIDLEHLLPEPEPAITAVPDAPAGADAAVDAAADAAAANEVVVEMLVEGAGTTFTFNPVDITIPVGTTVRWINRSEPRHTSTADPEWETPQGPAILPPGAMTWRSPFMREGETTTHTFTVPGMYQYFCETHGQYGMTGTITVTP